MAPAVFPRFFDYGFVNAECKFGERHAGSPLYV
jgi:hypothetical protein